MIKDDEVDEDLYYCVDGVDDDDVDMDVYYIVIVIDGYGKDHDSDSDDYYYDHDACNDYYIDVYANCVMDIYHVIRRLDYAFVLVEES